MMIKLTSIYLMSKFTFILTSLLSLTSSLVSLSHLRKPMVKTLQEFQVFSMSKTIEISQKNKGKIVSTQSYH